MDDKDRITPGIIATGVAFGLFAFVFMTVVNAFFMFAGFAAIDLVFGLVFGFHIFNFKYLCAFCLVASAFGPMTRRG